MGRVCNSDRKRKFRRCGGLVTRCGGLGTRCGGLEARCGGFNKIFMRVLMQRRFLNFRSSFVIGFQSSVVTMVYYATGHWNLSKVRIRIITDH